MLTQTTNRNGKTTDGRSQKKNKKERTLSFYCTKHHRHSSYADGTTTRIDELNEHCCIYDVYVHYKN